jgi:hypothetical protein
MMYQLLRVASTPQSWDKKHPGKQLSLKLKGSSTWSGAAWPCRSGEPCSVARGGGAPGQETDQSHNTSNSQVQTVLNSQFDQVGAIRQVPVSVDHQQGTLSLNWSYDAHVHMA